MIKKRPLKAMPGYVLSWAAILAGLCSLLLAYHSAMIVLLVVMALHFCWAYVSSDSGKNIKILMLLSGVSVVLGLLRIIGGYYYPMLLSQVLAIAAGIFTIYNLTFYYSGSWKSRGLLGKASRSIALFFMCLFAIFGAILSYFVVNPAGNSIEGNHVVTDVDSKVEIWGDQIPGNSSRSKLDDMKIEGQPNRWISMLRFLPALRGNKYRDSEAVFDTFTYTYSIQRGYEKETYEDVPYLIPYTVENSKGAVIIVPGGGYAFKSIYDGDAEGKDIAMSLNEAGISAFVLSYRNNPYERPIPQLDLQRAIRYVRFHADEYGFNAENIGLIGFSAGGNQVGSYIHFLMGTDQLPDGYQKDNIDEVDDSVKTMSSIYGMLSYNYNVPVLFASFNSELVKDQKTRVRLLEEMDIAKHLKSRNVSQFISYGTGDFLIDTKIPENYIDASIAAGTDMTVNVAEGQNHGYLQSHYMDDYLKWQIDRFSK